MMSESLQDKDDQWRERRANGATPVFDPGLSPLGTDAEAGGGAALPPREGAGGRPMDTSPEAGGIGARLTPKVWYALAALAVVIVVIAGVASL